MRTTDETKAIQFNGYFGHSPARTEQFVASIEFNKWDAKSLSVSVFMTKGGSPPSADELPDNVRLIAVDPAEPSVELSGISSVGWAAKRLTFDVGQVAVGIEDQVLPHGRTFSVNVRMRPSGILVTPGSRTLSYTGEIKKTNPC